MAKQSRDDRLKRLMAGLCPVHGVGMSQVDQIGAQTIVACDRSDCDIAGVEHHPSRRVTLLPRCEALLLGAA